MKKFENPVEDWLHAQESRLCEQFQKVLLSKLQTLLASPWIHVSALNSYLCTEFVNEMSSRKKTSVCFQRFMSGFYQINVAVSSPTEFNLEQNLHTSGKFCFQCWIKFQLQFSSVFTGWKYLCRIFFLFSRNIFCEDCIEEITRHVTHNFRLSEGLTKQHFYQNDFFQNDSLFALLLSWIIIIFPQWRLKILVSQLCASLTIFS